MILRHFGLPALSLNFGSILEDNLKDSCYSLYSTRRCPQSRGHGNEHKHSEIERDIARVATVGRDVLVSEAGRRLARRVVAEHMGRR